MSIRGEDWTPKLEDPEIRAYIVEECGEDALPMAHHLKDNPHVSGVDILETFKDQKPSAVRKQLYRLMQAHAAEYEKDTDAKGWETFYWDLDLNEIKVILRRRWADELLHLRQQLRFESDHQFYACAHQHRRILFEDAMDMQFLCPVCHEAMQPVRTTDVRRALENRIGELEPFVGTAVHA